jgi:hypothetical protein
MAKIPPQIMLHKCPEELLTWPAASFPAGGLSLDKRKNPHRGNLLGHPGSATRMGAQLPSPNAGDWRCPLFVLRERLQLRFFNVEVGVDVRNVFVIF